MDALKTLKALCSLDGVYSGAMNAAEEAKKMLAPFCDEIKTLNDGSIAGVKKCKNKNAKKIMIDAHIDEIGLMISEIDEKGFLHFVPVGGVDIKTLPASEVNVFGKKTIKGIIGTKPPHLQSADEHSKAFLCEDLTIDTGYGKEEIEKIVKIGDYALVCGEFTCLSENEYSSKSMDNRAGVCSVLMAAEALSTCDLDADVYYVFSCGEEFDMSGALIAANTIKPDISVSVDVTHGVTADNKESAYVLGDGPSYSVGPNISKKLVSLIKEAAIENKIEIHPEVDGGSSGTNAWAIQVAGTGVLTAVLSIPLKYMHTQVETIDISDIKKVSVLLCEFIKKASHL